MAHTMLLKDACLPRSFATAGSYVESVSQTEILNSEVRGKT